ncbi:MAG: DedA family protein [Bacteroidetes bacterium]|nr:DedA family protein [Bacteroidota bacterium]
MGNVSEFWNFIKELVNPESIITYGGFWLLLFVVFSETGLFIGFFLPGDSLLFTAGLFTATGIIDLPIFVVSMGICFAAIAGNSTGYLFGKRTGKAIFKREKSFFFKPSHLMHAKEFYDKHGGKAIILGAFLPIIRTFAPIIAGAVDLNYRKFIIYNISGAMLWSNSLVLTAYILGKNIPGIKDYLHYIVIFLIIITSVPFVITLIKKRNNTD